MTWTTRPRSEVGELAAIVAGDGPLLVLLHGVGLRAEAWAPVIDAMSDRFKVVAPDMPGHGESRYDESFASLDAYVEVVAGLLDRPAIVAGHSMGAMIALALAERMPAQVCAVLALNAVFERDQAAQDAVRKRAAALDSVSVADPGDTLKRWFGETPSPAERACRDWLTSVDPMGYRAAYSIFAHENGPNRTALANMSQPALFMTGADDPNSTPEMSQRMASLAAAGRAEVIEGAAHMLPMTHVESVVTALDRLAQDERM